MVTGLETAGLILAAFPLLVHGLTAYSKGVNTIRDWRGYRRILRQYARDLEGERVVYLNTLEELFIGIAPSEEELKQLIDNAGGPLWQNQEYDLKLRTRLDHAYDAYLLKLLALRELLETLSTKLDIPIAQPPSSVGFQVSFSVEQKAKARLIVSNNRPSRPGMEIETPQASHQQKSI
jgi:hypothetical protein